MSEENNQNMGEVTLMIRAIQEGNKDKINELIPATIKEIRRIAKQQLHKHNLNNDMSATTLVHELYIKFGNYINSHESFLEESPNPKSNEFFSICTKTIQHLIFDYCRRFKNKSQKTDSLDDITKDFSWLRSKEDSVETAFMVKEILEKLSDQGFQRKVKVFNFRYFGKYTDEDISKILGISIPTIQRDLRKVETELFFILNPYAKEIHEKAVKIPNREERERLIEEQCGDDERLQKAIKLLVR